MVNFAREEPTDGDMKERLQRFLSWMQSFDLLSSEALCIESEDAMTRKKQCLLRERGIRRAEHEPLCRGREDPDNAGLDQNNCGGLRPEILWQVNGVHLRGCTLRPCEEDCDAGLGVYTTDNQPEDGILMVTPLVLAITPMTALQDPQLGSVFAKLFEDGDVDDRLVIMLFLLVERLRGDSSFWAPYLKMLPTKFGMTLCFTEDELLELKGTALYKATKIQQANLKQHFEQKVKGLAEKILSSVGWSEREVEFHDFLWANCIFWTRALNIPCPHSLVIPEMSPMPPAWRQNMEQCTVDSTAVGESVRLNGGHPDLADENEHGSLDCSHQTQHGEGCPGYNDNSEVGHRESTISRAAAAQFRNIDNADLMKKSNQTSSEMEASGESEPESTIWVEGLVPGIDFCNHASRAHAVWEVDDQKGSTSGVPYSMYLVTGGMLPSDTEVRISYGNKGNEELLYLYGFVVDNNPDDYLMVHFPKEALEQRVSSEAKFLLLEEQKLPLWWLLPASLLDGGYVNGRQNKGTLPYSHTSEPKQPSHGYSWSGHRKPPPGLEKQVFPEELMAALRIISMTEDEIQGTTALLQDLSDPESQRIISAEDIRAAVWEACGNAGALQLLLDLLTAKMLEIEEGTKSADVDTCLLQNDFKAQIQLAEKQQQGSAYVGDEEFIEKNLLSRNQQACVVYRKGQKHLVHSFLQEVEYALQWWMT